uniref:Putative RNA dependent RNA polymerase n=1 Tax=Frankliniella occidentalis associated qin-like virus1 TaxID=2771469 RepID=A0A7H1D345_9VIRU|nr:putative RNA dependent RNA polymerase [Frankliniella occidentalis associated qin-like virus1]
MARVFDVPRYANQTKWKISSLLDICEKDVMSVKNRIYEIDMPERLLDKIKISGLYKAGARGIILDNLISSDRGVIDSPVEAYRKYVYQQGVFAGDADRYLINRKYGIVLREILELHTKGRIYTDDTATFMIVCKVLGGDINPTLPETKIESLRKANAVTIDSVMISYISCKLGSNVVNNFLKKYKHFDNHSRGWESSLAWFYCMESLKKTGPSLESKDATDIIRGVVKGPFPSAVAFEVKDSYARKYFGAQKIYKFLGYTILVFDEETYVLDGAQLDQLVEVSKSWEGYYSYAHNWRLCGDKKADIIRPRVVNAIDTIRDWMARTLRQKGYTVRLANSMKKSQAYIQNIMHDEKEPFDLGCKTRSAMLLESITGVIVLNKYFHQLLLEIDVPWRVKVDLSNMHHGLPCPDGDVFGLIKRLDTVLGNPNKVHWAEFKKTCDYKSSHDVCKVLINHKLRNKVKLESVKGYDYRNQPWYKCCMKGIFSLPDEEDWGKVKIVHSFPFTNSIKHWYMEAGDVSHVSCNPAYHGDYLAERDMDRFEKNELMYAMLHAPDIEPGVSTDNLLKNLMNGKMHLHKYDSTSVKMEANKYPPDSRDIHAADGVTRVLTAFYDRQAITISNQYSGIVARKSAQQVDKVFDTIASKVRESRKSGRYVICISTDIKGWSPTGDRHGWSYMSDMLFKMSKCKIDVKLEKLWDGLQVVVDKMGQYQMFELSDCLFQGWTPLCDSNLNLACNLRSVNKAKKRGLLSHEEAAWTATLIDDAIQCIELKKPRSIAELEQFSKEYLEDFRKTYADAAAELSLDKTLFSCIKFIFLNRYNCEGADVVQASKTYSKIDQPVTLRYQTILGKKNSIMGAGASAVMKGADPLVTYVTSFRRVVEILMDSARDVEWNDSAKYINFLFMPVSMGGMEMPNITNWLTSESPDKIVSWLGIMETLICINPSYKSKVEDVVSNSLNRKFDKPDAYTMMSSPRSVYIHGLVNPESVMTNAINSAMADKIESQVFKAAWDANSTRNHKKLMSEFLSTGTWDCSVLEMLASCLPNSWRSSLVSRIQKNEIVTMLLPFRKRVMLNKKIRSANREWIISGLNLRSVGGTHRVSLNRLTIMKIASDFREDYYRHNDVVFVNHTLPDWGVCLTNYQGPGAYCFKLWCDKPVQSCSEDLDGHTTDNYYDGIPPGGMRRPKKTAGFMRKVEDTVRNLTVIQKYMAKTVMLCEYIDAKKGDARMVYSFVNACWGAKEGEGSMTATSRIPASTSTKRLTGRLQVRSHQINCFPNTQGIVHVEGENWQRFVDRVNVHTDFLSIVTCIKVIGLLETGCGSNIDINHPLFFNILPGALTITNPTTYSCGDYSICAGIIREISNTPQLILRKMLLESVTTDSNDVVDLLVDEEEEPAPEPDGDIDEEKSFLNTMGVNEYPFKYTAIDWALDPDPAKQSKADKEDKKMFAQTTVTVPGAVKNTVRFSFNLADIPITSRKVRVNVMGTDEAYDDPGIRIETQIRRIKTNMDNTEAGLGLLLARVHENTPFRLSEKLNIGRRSEIYKEIDTIIPNWHKHWTDACRTVRSSGLNITKASVESCFGNLGFAAKNKIVTLKEKRDENAKKAYVECLLSVRGRPNCSEMYRILAAMDKKYLKECWVNASFREQYRGNHSIARWYRTLSEHVMSSKDKRTMLHNCFYSYGYNDESEIATLVGGLLKHDLIDKVILTECGPLNFSNTDRDKFKDTILDIMVLDDRDLRQDLPWCTDVENFPVADLELKEDFSEIDFKAPCEVENIGTDKKGYLSLDHLSIGGKRYPISEALWLIEKSMKNGTTAVANWLRRGGDLTGKKCSDDFLTDQDIESIIDEHLSALEQYLKNSDEA